MHKNDTDDHSDGPGHTQKITYRFLKNLYFWETWEEKEIFIVVKILILSKSNTRKGVTIS